MDKELRRSVIAYVPNWLDLATFSKTIDYAQLTHINLAFENPINDEGDLPFIEKYNVLIEQARANKVKILISVGGAAASKSRVMRERYFRLISERERAGFVAKLDGYVTRHGFDGLDVDLEGPAINQDYGAFIGELARALKPKGRLLTAALSKGYGGDRVPDEALKRFSFVNVMAYDATGPWDPNSAGPHSSFNFSKENVSYWLSRGLAKSKVVLGVPFYGWGFGEAHREDAYPYREIVRDHPGAEEADQVGRTIWYNGISTIRAKAKYVADEGLGGTMIWSLDQDATGELSLLTVICESLERRP